MARIAAKAFEHVVREQFDVLAACPQRRLVDAHHAQTVEQVGAKTPFLHRIAQVDVRRRHDPDVDRHRVAAAKTVNRTLLQKPQQARLAFVRQVADLVEQQRAAVRGFDVADLARVRAGKRATLVAEQFRLQQVRRNRTAVDRDERAVAPLRMAVDRQRREFLAGSRFAEHEHRCVGARETPHRIEQPQHRAAGAHDALFLRFELFAIAREQAFHAVGMADRIGDPLMRRRQCHVIETVVAQQRPHVRRRGLADIHERHPDNVAHRRAGRRDAADRIGVAAAQIENAARNFAGRVAQLARMGDDRHFPVAARQFLSQHHGRRLRPVNQRTLPVTAPRAGALIARYWHIHNEPSLSALREPFACAAAGGAWPPFRAAFPQLWRRSKLHTARTPGGRAGCHPASLSSNSNGMRGCGSHNIPALKRPAVRRGTSANGNSVRMCVASYTTVAPDAEPEGRQTAPGLTAPFHPHLNLHPVSR